MPIKDPVITGSRYDIVLPKLPLPPDTMSTSMTSSSTSNSSLSLSPPSSPTQSIESPKIMLTLVPQQSKVTHSRSCSSISNSSSDGIGPKRENSAVYVAHGDDGALLNVNSKSFHDVDFCFRCDKTEIPQAKTTRNQSELTQSCEMKLMPEIEEKVTITTATTSTSSSWGSNPRPNRRPRSTSSIGSVGRDHLKQVTEKTGEKIKDGIFVPLYRQVFLCTQCYNSVLKEKMNCRDFILKITPRARSYFQ